MDTTDPTDTNQPSAGTIGERLLRGSAAVSQIDGAVKDDAELVMDVVFQLTDGLQSPTLVTNGTVTYEGETAYYDPAPADRLVLAADDLRMEVTFTRIEGNLGTGSGGDFLSRSHTLEFTERLDGYVDAQLRSTRSGWDYTRTFTGTLIIEGREHLADLTRSGTDYDETSFGTFDFEDEARTTGTINIGDDAHEIDDTEYFRLIGSSASSALNHAVTQSGSANLDGDSYRWHDALTRHGLSDGKPSDVDGYWRATGELRKNGEPFGGYEIEPEPASAGFSFVLVLPGERITVKTFLN